MHTLAISKTERPQLNRAGIDELRPEWETDIVLKHCDKEARTIRVRTGVLINLIAK